ncbi:hypothetical protein BGX29_001425, partial [Mortierella sp. GBA35]
MSDTPSMPQVQPEASLDLDTTPVSIDTIPVDTVSSSTPTTITTTDKNNNSNASVPTNLADETNKDDIVKVTPSSSPQETPLPSPAPTSFYDGLDLDLEGVSSSIQPTSVSSTASSSPQSTPVPTATPSQSTTTTTTTTPAADSNQSGVSTDSNVTPSSTNRFGAKKIRVNPGSNISRRITMLASGKNENGSDLHTNDHVKAPTLGSGETTPDGSEYPDSFWEEILRSDQTTLARSSTSMPKPTPRSTTLTSKTSMPLRPPSTSTSVAATAAGTAGDDVEAAFVASGDVEEDLKRLQAELVKTKETKSKAEADAKAQRVTVMSLKTEVQLVRNVLK